MTDHLNPWISMPESSQRRAVSKTQFNLFWITDLSGRYGFCVQTEDALKNVDETIKLKGISILKRNSNNGQGELFLILNKKEDWEIFRILCEDLITTAERCSTENMLIINIDVRLKRWQQLLKQERNRELSIEIQMGLFAELLCLRDIAAPNIGLKAAIISWVGPEYDKQDFLMMNCAIEVKAYRTSKGEIVSISSLQQLDSPKDYLYLITNGLTCAEEGFSIEDIALKIKELLRMESLEISDAFESKLIEYGYIPELINKPLQRFRVDSQKAYLISETFPKIVRKNVDNEITAVKYLIDMAQCGQYEIGIDSLFEEDGEL